MLHASCFCKAIEFELSGNLRAPRHCYCAYCTKFAGTSPASWVAVNRRDIKLNSQGAVTRFDSGGGIRCFCANCGSPVWFESKEDDELVMLPLGVLDDGDIPSPGMHIWVTSKPGWCAIHDELPQHEKGPDDS